MLAWVLLFHAQILVDVPTTAKNPHSSPADVEMGRKIYGARCAGCHGPMGDGGKGTNLATPILPRSPDDLALWKVIRFGVPETEMPSHNLTNKEIWQIAAFVRTLGKLDTAPVAGDPQRGEALATGKGGCLGCHIVRGNGGELGPALTDIGLRRGPGYLRRKLTDPDRDSAGFLQVHLTTKAGTALSGIRMNEDTYSIQVRDRGNRLHSFWKTDLKELRIAQKSLMPSYSDKLSAQEIDDIVAYLTQLRGIQ